MLQEIRAGFVREAVRHIPEWRNVPFPPLVLRAGDLSRGHVERRLHAFHVACRSLRLPAFIVAHSPRTRSRNVGASLDPLAGNASTPLYRRIPWIAVAVTLLVFISAAVAESPVRDAASLAVITEARLDLSPGYIAVAPLSNVLDTLTLLGARQHIVVMVSFLVLYAGIRLWRVTVRRGPERGGSNRRTRIAREAGYAGSFVIAIVLLYLAAVALPRPMAAIVAEPSDAILVTDFHSHTHFSHDGRPGWDPSDVRAWHHAAGFDAAYISDHRTVQGAELGIAENPREAGQGTMLLQSLEVGWRGEHVNILGANRFYKGLTTPDLRDVDEQALTMASFLRGREPIVIETFPGRLDRIVPATGPGAPGIRAIEVIDGSPRGLDQTRILRSRIVHLADSLNIPMVAGSDNHGWGKAAPGWTLLIVPGWRGMGSDSLSSAVELSLRGGRDATRVVERRIPGELNGGNPLELALTLPVVVWGMFTTLSVDERVMWIIWAWTLVIVRRLTAGWRQRRQLRSIA